MEQAFEATLAAPFALSGRGLHTNRRARVTVAPAAAGHGIVFEVVGSGNVALSWENRARSRLNTALQLPDGSILRTVEHLAASLSAFGIDNAHVTVEGHEIPIFDGSARRWCAAIAEAGVTTLPAPRRYIRILKPVQVAANIRFLRAEPASRFELDVTGEHFYSGAVHAWRGEPSRAVFLEELAGSRSSGQLTRLGDPGPLGRKLLAPLLGPVFSRGGVVARQANAPRADLPSAIADDIRAKMPNPGGEPVLRGARPWRSAIWLGPWVVGGARYPDERTRHNALDLLGDLRLAGHPILGRIVANRLTHKLTFAFVATLMRRTDAWEWWTPNKTEYSERQGPSTAAVA